MAITYPLTVPNHNFESMTMRMKRVVAVSESSFTLQQQVYEHQGARWEAEVTLPPLTHAEARLWEAFFLKLHGQRGTFIMGNPLHTNSAGTITSASVSGSNAARSQNLVISGTSGQTIKAGDYFQIGTGSSTRLHQVVDDATISSGTATLQIEPPLRSTVSSGSVDFTLPKGLWRLSSNDVQWNINNASIYGFTFACVEAL